MTRDVPFSMYGKHETTVAAAGKTIPRQRLFRKVKLSGYRICGRHTVYGPSFLEISVLIFVN